MTSNYQEKYLKYKIKYLELKNNLEGGGFLKNLTPQFIKNEICHNDTLIISTGDISDVDGFIALAEYAKSGADVVFIMNYPAYLNNDSEKITIKEDGLGYSYNAKEAIYKTDGYNQIISEALNKALTITENMSDEESEEFKNAKEEATKSVSTFDTLTKKQNIYEEKKNMNENYKKIINTFNLNEQTINNDNLKKAFKHLAYYMMNKVWDEVRTSRKGKIFFYDGGINKINPFHSTTIKNELLVYAESITDIQELSDHIPDFNINNIKNYDNIYIDFNGSMAFLNKKWLKVLDSVKDNIKAVAIMGGVRDFEEPLTMSALKNILNRFGYATMNQLYHPENTKNFFDFLNNNPCIKRYIVTNNLVNKYFPKPDDLNAKQKQILKINYFNSNNKYLELIANLYYNSIFDAQPQPFDYFTALIINNLIYGNDIKEDNKYNIVYNNDYALTIVSKDDNIDKIKNNINLQIQNLKSNNSYKYNSYQTELRILHKLSKTNFIKIEDVIEPQFNSKEITQISII